MILISIFGFELKPCFDIGGSVFLFDRKLLPQQQNIYGLVFNIKLITITGVAEMQIVDQYINTEILLNFNRIFVQIKVYLVNNLQLELIIGMNVLNKGDIDLLFSRQSLRVGNIEISLCYTFSSMTGGFSYYISYYFIAGHTNSYNVTQSKQRK